MADELAEIDGIKPKVKMVDGDEREVGSTSSKSVYKVKRTWDHYYCTCPAWRNQSGAPTNARTCKHLKTLLGEKYEEARLKLKNPDATSSKAAPKKPASKGKGKAPAKRKKVDEDDEEDEVPEKPAKRVRKPVSKGKSGANKPKDEDEVEEQEQKEEQEEGEEQNVPSPGAKTSISSPGVKAVVVDELAQISGVKPKVYMADGDEKEVKSLSSDSVYKIKRTWDHYYCTCPAWRNQGGVPTNARTCKHLKSLLGDKYEEARLKLKNPYGPPSKGSPKKKPSSKAKAKAPKRKGDDDNDDDEGEDADEDDDDPASGKKVPGLLLANKWDIEKGADPTGWWISEKLDGVRTYYDGERMISRLGNPFTPPQWFLDKLPKDITLDGELFGGRGQFQSTVSIVKTINSPHWQEITFQIFDIPSRGDEPFEDRIDYLKKSFGPNGSHTADQIEIVEHVKATSRDHVLEKLKEIESLGGEGLMLRRPGSVYEGQRSSSLLKIKTFYDAEAVVTGYVPGKGRNAGVTGALKCKMASGKTFNVGTGLNDKQRKNPPKIGTIIIYRFQELTRDGVPRFPSYIGEAIDKNEAKDAEIPEHRKVSRTVEE